jgi:hypothetical protein
MVMIGRVSGGLPTDSGAADPADPPKGVAAADVGCVVADVAPRRADDEHATAIVQTNPTADTTRTRWVVTAPKPYGEENLDRST